MKVKKFFKTLLLLALPFLLYSCGNSLQPSPELQGLINEKNKTAPIDYDEYTTFTKVSVKGSSVVFEYDISADPEGRLNDIGEYMKEQNIELLKAASESGTDKLYLSVKKEGFGLAYKYNFTLTGEELLLEFTNDVLP